MDEAVKFAKTAQEFQEMFGFNFPESGEWEKRQSLQEWFKSPSYKIFENTPFAVPVEGTDDEYLILGQKLTK